MSLSALGLCGVDDSIDVEMLRILSIRYPLVEYGVLFRADKVGQPRYPTQKWVEELAAAANACQPPMRLAAHLCGQACATLLNTGSLEWVHALIPMGFSRVQINATKVNGVFVPDLQKAAVHLKNAIEQTPELDFIIQANEETKPLWEPFMADPSPPFNVSILFDASCGTGQLATTFAPKPRNNMRFGYAGGLGPTTVVEVLRALRDGPAKGETIWIDMESGLRSKIDGKDAFDFRKAQTVCKLVDKEGWEQPMLKDPAPPPPPPPPNVRKSGHPLLAHKLTLMRDFRTPPRDFRQLLREVTFHIGYEASSELATEPRCDVISPCGPVPPSQAAKLAERIALIPILRSGLGMVDAMLELLPNAVVHHIGLFKTGKDTKPIEYYSRLPKDSVADLAFILEPCIATSKTALAAISKLKGWGATKIVIVSIIASFEGLADLQKAHPDVTVYTVHVDSALRRDGFVYPGFGDVGDRQFGTPAGNPTSKNIYAPVFSAEGRLRTDSAITSPLHKPVTRVLGEYAAYVDISKIPEVSLTEASSTALTTHDGSYGSEPVLMNWGAPSPELRGPVLATSRHNNQRNAIGAHSGGYSVYRALAVVSKALDDAYFPKLGMTTPVARIGPFPAWRDPKRIVTIDPYGHAISEGFGPWLEKGYDVRPTIAVTKAHIELPECREALREGRLTADGAVLSADGQSFVTKAAIEPVWYLPGVAERFGVTEDELRDAIFKETNSMYPELLTRRDLKLFLPPIGGMTVYIWGDPEKINDESVELTCRVHDECNGSDVFGSDICTCRPYLTHAIEECIKCAQRGGTGIVVYFRKEGRALGEVTKYLVYNMRKRQEGGDKAAEYFNCTKEVAGVTDTRFQVLMPDVLHWLGVTKIHRFISMSDMKHDAIVSTGIKIVERVEIPPEMVPKDAHVEIAAKVAAGYHSGESFKAAATDPSLLDKVKGREYTSTTEYEKSVKEGHGAQGKAQGA
mmetsp:Transcript_96622/g.201950  ORF Transcript_96622/g.201950 Transcript_96622/m.201950 type:complete len:971 (-) Transcript_96622:53-2965(-)|eukprot:CAMPEP_0206453690 /NCGR_PEP_ID=MMETSP0324_2-20121206/20694_1 /ASSEMBLY_ACC=CAM_ASM_000836 /TAXON_ID=2866 /ORGANISM="Crypthecodinium cohnii, Strain Seligo" /LENGTH=970 /DNA_ID=CAMNT_0053924025 /DNA_START=102 /DNA_END=3014 /DNA_ORIENTATION=-